MKIVVDTNVIVSALRNPAGASGELLRRVRRKELTLLASVPLFLEYEEVLSRDEQLVDLGLTLTEVGSFLNTLSALVEPVEIRYLWRPMLVDRDDDMVIETAFNGGTRTIVSFNKRDLSQAEGLGMVILLPSEFLRKLQQ